MSRFLDKSQKSRRVSTISTRLDNLDKNLDASKSQLKNLDFKNLDWEKKKVDLDRRENLNNLKKFVSTRRTFSILISIGLDCRDPQPYKELLWKIYGFFWSQKKIH
jgi:hypothetical protein